MRATGAPSSWAQLASEARPANGSARGSRTNLARELLAEGAP